MSSQSIDWSVMRNRSTLAMLLTAGLIAGSLVWTGLLDDWMVRYRVYRLQNLRPGQLSAIDPTLEDLTSEHPPIRAAAARGLGLIGHAEERVTVALIHILDQDTNSRMASEAAWSLGHLPQPDDRVLQALARGTTHKNAEVRRYSAYALSRLGADAGSKREELIALLNDPAAGVVCTATQAPWQLGGSRVGRSAIASTDSRQLGDSHRSGRRTFEIEASCRRYDRGHRLPRWRPIRVSTRSLPLLESESAERGRRYAARRYTRAFPRLPTVSTASANRKQYAAF